MGILWFAYNFAPGSYPHVEKYELDYSQDEVKIAVDKFKKQHSEFIVPTVTINNKGSLDLTDGQSNEITDLYKIYFYYKDEQKIIYTWIQPLDNNKTIFAFVAINKGLNLGNWEDINKDFSDFENKEEKRKFEEKILNKIKELLSN
ncbi:hypothetical protein SAMN05421741_1495 [Paenimyroides ummariense]|uniref:Uncharacterized protein n=2 Tax=Paenimyroides ummariense TaxID=913024 RepID=A0A1I5GSH6_9FLAO|nr:hypothetical protein SAMN05421741_1495 [Paenimyroides ummariense]